jgi:hypothetical protein
LKQETTYEELKNLKFGIEIIRNAEFRHEQLRDFYIFLKLSLSKGNPTMTIPKLRQVLGKVTACCRPKNYNSMFPLSGHTMIYLSQLSLLD